MATWAGSIIGINLQNQQAYQAGANGQLTVTQLPWPYSPGASEAALQIGGAFGVTGTRKSGTVQLPLALTFPVNGGDVPITSVPPQYSWLADTIDAASTFWETIKGEGYDSNAFTCKRGTRWGRFSGVSYQGSVPGLNPPTVDGGHPVPALLNLIEDPVTSTDPIGRQTAYPGIPLYIFMYPGTQDVWGIFLVTKDDHTELTADTYTPAWVKDKVGTLPSGSRKVAHGLFMRARKMDPAEVKGYLDNVKFIKDDQGCSGFTLSGIGWFIENAGEFIVATILELAKDVAAAIGGMACELLKDPEAAQALALGLSVIAGGAAKGQNPQSLMQACQAGQLPQCPPGYVMNMATKMCAPAPTSIPWLPILIIGGVLTFLLFSGSDKPKPAPAASP